MSFSSICSSTTVVTGLDKEGKMGSRMHFEDIPFISDSPYTFTSGHICLKFQGQSTVKRPQQLGGPTSSCRLHLGTGAFAISQFNYGTNRCLWYTTMASVPQKIQQALNIKVHFLKNTCSKNKRRTPTQKSKQQQQKPQKPNNKRYPTLSLHSLQECFIQYKIELKKLPWSELLIWKVTQLTGRSPSWCSCPADSGSVSSPNLAQGSLANHLSSSSRRQGETSFPSDSGPSLNSMIS